MSKLSRALFTVAVVAAVLGSITSCFFWHKWKIAQADSDLHRILYIGGAGDEAADRGGAMVAIRVSHLLPIMFHYSHMQRRYDYMVSKGDVCYILGIIYVNPEQPSLYINSQDKKVCEGFASLLN